jgi:hypothetical protein
MTYRDELGTSHVPAIDWLELFIWGALITMSSAGAALFIR